MTQALFATGALPVLSAGYIDGHFPYLTIDGIFADPLALREAALALPFSAGTAHYPGRIARFPESDPSLTKFLRELIGLVTREYLPRLPPLPGGDLLLEVRGVDTDFAITDTHPSKLTAIQRKPHIDAVPIFGLVYLNEEPRGGTLFFRKQQQAITAASGYPSPDDQLEVCGYIEGRFNRLAIYPGFVLHSGEIKGDWIEGDDRFTSPRLTQRVVFFF